MKIKTIILLYFFVIAKLYSQSSYYNDSYDYSYYGSDAKPNIDKYIEGKIKAEFDSMFTKDKKNDFKALREFLKKKEDLYKALKIEVNKLYFDKSKKNSYKNEINRRKQYLERLISSGSDNGEYQVESSYLYMPTEDEYYGGYIDHYERRNATESEIKKVIQGFAESTKKIDEGSKELNEKIKMLSNNMNIVEQDKYNCIAGIESALAPEYHNQDFRTKISTWFALLIGVLLLVFFYIVFKKSDNTLSKELLSGNGLQFITLFVLIIVITLFGILSILQGSELAAILSGISGYILGKGIPKSDNGSAPANVTETSTTDAGNKG